MILEMTSATCQPYCLGLKCVNFYSQSRYRKQKRGYLLIMKPHFPDDRAHKEENDEGQHDHNSDDGGQCVVGSCKQIIISYYTWKFKFQNRFG